MIKFSGPSIDLSTCVSAAKLMKYLGLVPEKPYYKSYIFKCLANKLTLHNNNQATLSKDGHAWYRLHNIKFHIYVPELICTYTHFCEYLCYINWA